MGVAVAPGRLPFLGHTVEMMRRRHEFTSSLRDHGDVVRVDLGPLSTYFVTNPRLAHQVLVTDGARFRKGAMFDKFQPYLGNGLLLSNGPFHLRQRRMIQPAFHRDRIARYTEVMTRAATALTSSWTPGGVRVVEDDMQGLAVTVVGEALFSTEMGQRAIAEVRRSIFVVIKQGMVRALSPSFAEKLPLPGNREFDRAIARMRAIVLEVIASRRADAADRGDLLSMLLLAEDDSGDGMTDQQTYDEVLTLLTAGIETTALALAWVFHEIAEHPDVEKRLVAEIDEVVGGRPVTFTDVPRLTYTAAVVNEVLRMYPVWILMRRATAPVDLGGVELPAGTEVIVSPHALHHDPASFPQPHRFDPDRWLSGSGSGSASGSASGSGSGSGSASAFADVPRGAFIPFGAGARQCMGNVFAQTEIVITLATVLSKWRLVPVPGKPVRTKFTSAAYPSGLLMTAVPR